MYQRCIVLMDVLGTVWLLGAARVASRKAGSGAEEKRGPCRCRPAAAAACVVRVFILLEGHDCQLSGGKREGMAVCGSWIGEVPLVNRGGDSVQGSSGAGWGQRTKDY